MTKFLSKHRVDLLLILLLGLTLPLFFYKLGQSSLVSWDEAWYAEIARNILKSGSLLNLKWNGQPYTDHPPAGFWMIAIGIKAFGSSEFGVRFASAVSGFICLISVYFIGRILFNRAVGFASSLGLASSIWFIYRARSGNLDVFLTMFFLLTLLFALKACKNRFYLIPFSLSFSFLILSKTLVPITIIPALLIIFWPNKLPKKGELKRLFMPVILSLSIVILIVGSWYWSQLHYKSDFISRYFMIGLPGVSAQTAYLDNFNLTRQYLHEGVGKWFWPGILGILGGLFLLQRRFYIMSIFFLSFFIPFVFSPKGHIWHLIPLHPVLILAFFGFSFWFFQVSLGFLNKRLRWKKSNWLKYSPGLLIILFSFYISFIQIKTIWYQFIEIPSFISDEDILSREAGKYQDKFFIDGDFGPTAVWYSQKKVQSISNQQIEELFYKTKDFANTDTFILITKQYRLDDIKAPKDSYKVLKLDRDMILIRFDRYF